MKLMMRKPQPARQGKAGSQWPIVVFMMVFMASAATAVQLNHEGEGEVLIYPFYSVNKNLNTAYTIVNTSDRFKALKVTFREAQVGLVVLSFNVYLAPFDVWTGVLGATESTQPDHQGEPSVVHVSADASCAAGVDKAGTEFNARQLDEEFFPSNRSMQRSRTGFLEVLELGELSGLAAEHINHNNAGVPNDCDAIVQAWADAEWDFEPLSQPSGHLTGTAVIVNVAEGVSMSYDAVALQNFWAADGLHTAPGSALPDLSSGSTHSRVLLDDGSLAESAWSTGYQAVSAVLMHSFIINEYAVDTMVNGQAEWVVTFPTKHHHVLTERHLVKAPFQNAWNGLSACDEYQVHIRDREAQVDLVNTGGVGGVPPPRNPELCQSVNVLSWLLPGTTFGEFSRVLGHQFHNPISTTQTANATQNGWAWLAFEIGPVMTPESGYEFTGMPVTGFLVQQFTNGNAGEGLIAQYGSISGHKGQVTANPIDD